jgi:type IV secretory pathway TrbD component
LRPTQPSRNESILGMLLWIILGLSWAGILLAAISLFRLASYADKKMRRLAQRTRRREDTAA